MALAAIHGTGLWLVVRGAAVKMYLLNKIVGAILNPVGLALAFLFVAVMVKILARVSVWQQRTRHACFALAWFLVAIALAWIYFWSIPTTHKVIGGWLERPYKIQPAEEAPVADAIVVLGGGVCAQTNGYPYADLQGASDRAWHAARLFRAGKASLIITTGYGGWHSDARFLRDLGVPGPRIIVEDASRNTEENAIYAEKALLEHFGKTRRAPKILLVTSAWHMRRSELLFRKYAPRLEVTPCATDFEATMKLMDARGRYFISDFIPDAGSLSANAIVFKEIVGLVGYSLFR